MASASAAQTISASIPLENRSGSTICPCQAAKNTGMFFRPGRWDRMYPPASSPRPASANAAGEAIDSMKWSEVMGTIAGDNTLLIITRSSEAAEALMTKFNTMLNG